MSSAGCGHFLPTFGARHKSRSLAARAGKEPTGSALLPVTPTSVLDLESFRNQILSKVQRNVLVHPGRGSGWLKRLQNPKQDIAGLSWRAKPAPAGLSEDACLDAIGRWAAWLVENYGSLDRAFHTIDHDKNSAVTTDQIRTEHLFQGFDGELITGLSLDDLLRLLILGGGYPSGGIVTHQHWRRFFNAHLPNTQYTHLLSEDRGPAARPVCARSVKKKARTQEPAPICPEEVIVEEVEEQPEFEKVEEVDEEEEQEDEEELQGDAQEEVKEEIEIDTSEKEPSPPTPQTKPVLVRQLSDDSTKQPADKPDSSGRGQLPAVPRRPTVSQGSLMLPLDVEGGDWADGLRGSTAGSVRPLTSTQPQLGIQSRGFSRGGSRGHTRPPWLTASVPSEDGGEDTLSLEGEGDEETGLIARLFKAYASGSWRGQTVFSPTADLTKLRLGLKSVLPHEHYLQLQSSCILDTMFEDTIQLQCYMLAAGYRRTTGLDLEWFRVFIRKVCARFRSEQTVMHGIEALVSIRERGS